MEIQNVSSTYKKSPQRGLGGLIFEVKKNWLLFLMLAPAVILVFVLNYIPMAGITVAFRDLDFNLGMWRSPWIGLENFEFFFRSGRAVELTINTFGYNIAFRIVNLFLELTFAIILSELAGKHFKKFLQSAMILPFFLSWVIIGGFVFNILSYEFGLLNGILRNLGLETLNIYGTPSFWPGILIGANAWRNVGYGMIIYLAAIAGINTEFYESAYLDGAGLFKRIWYITLPLLKPTVIVLILLGLNGILRGNLDMFFNLIGFNGHLFAATDVIDTFVFRSLIGTRDFGMSAAAGFYQQIIGFVIVITANGIIRKANPDYALF